MTKSTPAREPVALRWPLPEPPLVPPALCKPRRQRKQRASAAPGAAAAGCQLDARQSRRATSPAGLGASRRGRPRDAPWRAREHTRACLCALACTSVRSPPPTTWSAPEAKACPFGVHHAHVARASALLDGAVLHELPVRSDSVRTRGPVCIRTSCPAPQAYAPGPQEVRRRPVRPRPHVRQVRYGCGVARVSAQRATGHRGVSWPRPLAPGQAWARRACRRPGRARSQTAPPGRRRPRP